MNAIPIIMDSTSQNRQCWECAGRRLVCDSSPAGCNKCRAAGMDCPGYGDKKPLKWLVPGKVTSRIRHRQGPPTGIGRVQAATIRGKTDETNAPVYGGKDQAPKMTISLGYPRVEMRAAIQAALYCKLSPRPMRNPILMACQSTPKSTPSLSQCISWRQTHI